MLTRLTKSAEAQTRTDEEYFTINMDGHEIRLKWENTLKNCYQVLTNPHSTFPPKSFLF
jgi:hypothetical protein